MTKATILAITTFVWTAGFAATGAFVYTVSKPLPKQHFSVAAMPEPRVPHALPDRTIILPAVEIVGTMPHPSIPSKEPVFAVRAVPPSVDPANAIAPKPQQPRVVHCSEWRPLEQGSASVQLCE